MSDPAKPSFIINTQGHVLHVALVNMSAVIMYIMALFACFLCIDRCYSTPASHLWTVYEAAYAATVHSPLLIIVT